MEPEPCLLLLPSIKMPMLRWHYLFEMNAFELLFRSSHLERGAMCSAGRINIGGAKTQHFFSYRITSSAHCAGILDNILLQ